MEFDTIILSDHHTLALENKAFREGALSPSDHFFSKFVEPEKCEPTELEGCVLDLVCLYDELLVPEKRFKLDELNKYSDAKFIIKRPDIIRESLLSLSRKWDPGFDGTSTYYGFEFSKLDWEHLTDSAFWEAQYLITIDIESVLEDAKSAYESQRTVGNFFEFDEINISHSSIVNYLKLNAIWIVELFDEWFKFGGYNHLIDESALLDQKLPNEVVYQFRYFSQSLRFEYYFQYLQEAYSNTYENSFIGRLYGIEQAYHRSPAKHTTIPNHVGSLEVSQTIRVNLADISEYFPLPRNFEEAIEFKHSKQMESFRSVLCEWISAVSNGSPLEEKIRRDLKLANRDIKRLRNIRNLREKPLYFGLKVLANNIPIISNIASVIDIIEYFYERNIGKRTAWVVTPRL